MDYKKRYRKQREKNKSLMDRIEDLKSEISELNVERYTSIERVQNLVNELEDIRQEFLLVIKDLDRCKENYIMIRKMVVQNKKMAMFNLKIADFYLDIKYKLMTLFRRKKYR